MSERAYDVTMPLEAWQRVGGTQPGLVERFRSQLGRLAAELSTPPGGGRETRTVVVGDGYSALVLIDHEARRLLLREVTRPIVLGG